MVDGRKLRRAGVVASALAVTLGLAIAPSCVTNKGALLLAVTTDMQTPKDISVVSIFVSTNSVVKFDYLGRVLPDGTLSLPATLAVVEPDDPGAQVRVRVVAFQETTARVVRDILTTVPHGTTALLRIPLSFLDDGSANGTLPLQYLPIGGAGGTAPEGDTTFDPDTIGTRCDFSQRLTSVAGQCVSALLDSSRLPAYTQDQVFGPEGGGCFDVTPCFDGGTLVSGVDPTTCSFPLPAGTDPATLNLALGTSATGACQGGQCLVPLAEDAVFGWTVAQGTVTMAAGVCTKLTQAGAQLVSTTGVCAALLPTTPVCQPASAGAADGGPIPDGGSPASDAAGDVLPGPPICGSCTSDLHCQTTCPFQDAGLGSACCDLSAQLCFTASGACGSQTLLSPVLDPVSGSVFTGSGTVTLSTPGLAPAGMQMFYTTDGTVPTVSGATTSLYDAPITVSVSETIIAIAHSPSGVAADSPPVSASYTVE